MEREGGNEEGREDREGRGVRERGSKGRSDDAMQGEGVSGGREG